MSANERRDRNRAEMRDVMLAAVRELAASGGWHGVSIRKVAERIDFSPTLLYQYFESKDAVVQEIRRLGYEELCARLVKAGQRARDPHHRLVLLARANVDHAFDEPEVFKAMLGMDGSARNPPADVTAPGRIADLLRVALQRAGGDAQIEKRQLDEYAEAFFAAVQGVVTMYLNAMLLGGRKRALTTVDTVVTGLTHGWFPSASLNSEAGRPATAGRLRPTEVS